MDAQAGRHGRLDLGAIHGSGSNGAGIRGDVERIAPTPAIHRLRLSRDAPVLAAAAVSISRDSSPARSDSVVHAADLPSVLAPAPAGRGQGRSATAALTARARREIPRYYLTTDIDLLADRTWLRTHNALCP